MKAASLTAVVFSITFCCLCEVSAEMIEVGGRVDIYNEESMEFTGHHSFYFHRLVVYYYDASNRPCGRALVDDRTLIVQTINVIRACVENELTARLRYPDEFDWQQDPLPMVVCTSEALQFCASYELKLLVSENLSTAQRQQLIGQAESIIETDSNKALQLLVEASRGSDTNFTAVAANLLEANNLQGDVWRLYQGKDLNALYPSRQTLASVRSRIGNAYLVAGQWVNAMDELSQAASLRGENSDYRGYVYASNQWFDGAQDPGVRAAQILARFNDNETVVVLDSIQRLGIEASDEVIINFEDRPSEETFNLLKRVNMDVLQLTQKEVN